MSNLIGKSALLDIIDNLRSEINDMDTVEEAVNYLDHIIDLTEKRLDEIGYEDPMAHIEVTSHSVLYVVHKQIVDEIFNSDAITDTIMYDIKKAASDLNDAMSISMKRANGDCSKFEILIKKSEGDNGKES